MRKPVTLIAGQFGSRHFGTRPYLEAAVRSTGKPAPSALYIGAANGDDGEFGTALCVLLTLAGARRVVWRAARKRRGRSWRSTQTALETVDFVLIGGGDVETGMNTLRDADLLSHLRAAAERGVAFAGMSAGAIMLGERWIRWPRADAGDGEAETYECLGIAPCSVDTHGESDGWKEARSFAAVRARELGRKATAYAVPSGGALVVGGDGKMYAHGEPVPVFAAQPRKKAKLERTLRIET